MDRPEELRTLSVGASDEYLKTLVDRGGVLVLQFIGAEGTLRILGGESNHRTMRVSFPDGGPSVECGPGGEVGLPLRFPFLVEQLG